MPLSFNAVFLKRRLGITEIETTDKESELHPRAGKAKVKAHAWLRMP